MKKITLLFTFLAISLGHAQSLPNKLVISYVGYTPRVVNVDRHLSPYLSNKKIIRRYAPLNTIRTIVNVPKCPINNFSVVNHKCGFMESL